MNLINVMLVDDHEESIEILQYFIGQLSDYNVVGICKNGEELIDQVMENKPDLLLTDINMPEKTGLQAVKECLAFFPQLKFIFITGYDEYALEAFQIAAIDYIVKPIEKYRLYQALEKAKNVINFERSQKNLIKLGNLPLKDVNGTTYVLQEDIYFIEKVGKKCLVYTKKKIYETNENISKLSEKLDDYFYPAHRSFLINLKKVAYIMPQSETYVAFFQDYDKQAGISKLKINEVKERMEEYL